MSLQWLTQAVGLVGCPNQVHSSSGWPVITTCRATKTDFMQTSTEFFFFFQVPVGWTGFAYVCDGSGQICGTQGSCQHALVFGPGDHVTATTNDEQGLRFLLVAGQPIGEPVVQYGPFVMNTEVKQTQRPLGLHVKPAKCNLGCW